MPYGYSVSGGTVGAPDDPTREGFIFRGWYEDEAYTTLVSFPYTVSGNATLYAEWANVNGTGTLHISSSPAGADVYVDGNFTKAVSPCELALPAGAHKVELKIKGYETYSNENVQIFADEATVLSSIVQLPALTETDADHTITVTTLEDKVRWSDVSGMNSITVAQLKADTGTTISLREAIQAVKNEPAGNGHYRIEFASGLKGGTISLFKPGDLKFPVEDWMLQNLYIEKRGNMTINGDIDRDGAVDITLEPYTNGSPSSPKGSVLNVYTSDVTLAGIIFKGDEALSYSTLIFRVPDKNTQKYDVNNVRVLGCTLDHSQGTGVATCGGYGYGGTSYGGAGTTNFTDFVFSGNTFTKTSLFSFAGAGDEDYNVIDGYYICANRFYNGNVGILAADAHTWYVYGSNDPNGNGGVAGQVGFCEHNQLKNIYVTGNYFEHTENAGIIGATTANQGNSNNLIENMYVRNNTAVAADGIECGVSLENASIGRDDRYTSDQLSHNTANNIMRNVYIENNDFEIGDKSRFGIYNIQGGCVRDSYMDGTGNLIENIQIKDNRIECDFGAYIRNIGGECGTINNDVSENTMRNIVFSGNELTGVDTDWIACGLEVTNHSNVMNTHIASYHDNAMSDITVENNTISGYQKGIVVAGSLGNGVDAHSIEDVTVSGNTIACKADGQFGLIVSGNSIDGYGGDSYNGSTNCEAKNITISGNNIAAPGGILLAGTYVNAPVKRSLEGNKISTVSVYSNTITWPEGTDVNRPVPGITAADIIEPWPRIEADTILINNSCGQPDIHDNTITGFITDVLDMSQLTSSFPVGALKTAEEILGDYKASAEAVFGANSMDWYWYGGAFSSFSAGTFTAAGRRIGQIGFDYLYECVNVTGNTELNITAQPNDASYGSVSGGGIYVSGDPVTLTAAPKNGYRFVRWTEDGAEVSTNAVYTFAASCSREITAEFAAIGTPSITTPVSYNYDRAALTWSMVDGAAGYEVWRASYAAGTYTKIAVVPDASYTNIGLKAGTKYYYKIKAYCDTGAVKTYGSLSAYVSVRPVPLAPATCTASAADYDSIKVEWTKVSGAGGYMVYRSTSENGTYSRIATTSRTYYTNNYVATGATYWYKVRAYRSYTSIYGNCSPVAAAATSLKPMSGVIAATYYPTAIKISWNAVPGRTKYYVYRSDTLEGEYKYIGYTTYTYYKNTGLAVDKTYYYQVRAYRLVGTKKVYNDKSEPVSDTTRVFQVKNVKAAMYAVTSNKITWSSVPGASGYEVSRCDAEGNVTLALPATGYTYFYDKTIIAGQTYYYKVRAYRTVGTERKFGAYSDLIACESKVAGIKAYMYSVNSNKISWSAVSGRYKYEIWRSDAAGTDLAYWKETAYTYIYDKDIDKTKTYYYKVRAYILNSLGEKVYCGFSDTVNVANKVAGIKAYSYSYSSNKITWNPVAGRTNYEVWSCDSAGDPIKRLKTWGYTYYINTGLTTGQTYYYRVRAYQTIGGVPVYSNFSDFISAVPTLKGVTGAQAARYNNSKIKLSWYSVSGAIGYVIQRCTTGNDIDFVTVKTTTTTSAYYYDGGLSDGTKYYYRICAYRTVGGTPCYGEWSKIVSATP